MESKKNKISKAINALSSIFISLRKFIWMPAIISGLNELPPSSASNDGEELFSLLLTKCPYYTYFDIHAILKKMAEGKEFDFDKSSYGPNITIHYGQHLNENSELEHLSFTQYLIRNGFATKYDSAGSRMVQFTESGRELKRLGSFANYKKHIESEIGYKEAIKSIPTFQKRYNIITTVFVILSFFATIITCRNNNRTYEMLQSRFNYDTLRNNRESNATNHKIAIPPESKDTVQIYHKEQQININISSPK